MKHYVITGATGVVGNAIAERLLRQGDSVLHLLVRANNHEQAVTRVRRLVEFWGLNWAQVEARIEVLQGDATLPRFGLSERQHAALTELTTHVVHCAALVRMNLPLDEARKSAVDAAKQVLALAHAAQQAKSLQKVEFVSTVGVAGRTKAALEERWLTTPRQFHNTYEHAKADAEVLAADACAAGLPLTAHRLSMVVGDSVTGKVLSFQIFYHLLEFLSGRRTAGFFPSLHNATLDLVPVDLVAQAICWSSQTPNTIGRVLHLCAGPEQAVPLTQLRTQVRTTLRPIRGASRFVVTIPTPVLHATLPVLRTLLPQTHRRALGTLPIFLDYLAGRQVFSNTATQRLLADAGITLPRTEAYLPAVLAYYFANRNAPQPSQG